MNSISEHLITISFPFVGQGTAAMVLDLMLKKLCADLNLHRSINLLDVAELNLICAMGLPGAEGMDIDAHLCRLDEIATDVGRIIFLAENYSQFLNCPDRFHNSQAYFCVVCMLSILRAKYDVRYNPKWQHITPESEIPKDFCSDAKDQHIHAILDGVGGTCGSLPVFFVAIGRRLGFPLKLVKAYRHLFVRWDDPAGSWISSVDGLPSVHGEVFNIEATGQGIHSISDADYATRWPKPIPQKYIDAGIYLRSLTPEEELAEFLAARSYCQIRNGQLRDGANTLERSCELTPHNLIRKTELLQLRAQLEVLQRRPYLNQSSPTIVDEHSNEPRWILLSDGTKMLIQILRPHSLMPSISRSLSVGHDPILQPSVVQLPNGQTTWAEIPIQTNFRPMAAYWIELSSSEFAMVHKPMSSIQQPFEQFTHSQAGMPVLPPSQSNYSFMTNGHRMRSHSHSGPLTLSPYEEHEVRQHVIAIKEELSGVAHPLSRLLKEFDSLFGTVPTPASLPPVMVPPAPFLKLSF